MLQITVARELIKIVGGDLQQEMENVAALAENAVKDFRDGKYELTTRDFVADGSGGPVIALYGDKFPLSPEGRIVACLLMTAGVGLFGTFTGFVASLFLEPQEEKEEGETQQIIREIRQLRTQMQAIETKLDENNSKDH